MYVSRMRSHPGGSSPGTNEGSPVHILQRPPETALGPWMRTLKVSRKGYRERDRPGCFDTRVWAHRPPASAGGWFQDPPFLGTEAPGSSSRLPGRPWAWYMGKPVFHTLDRPGGYHTPIRNLRSSGTGKPEPDEEVSTNRSGDPRDPLRKGRGNPNPETRTIPEDDPGHRGYSREGNQGNLEEFTRHPIEVASSFCDRGGYRVKPERETLNQRG